MENNKTKIKVVDSIMGSGKSSWAINYMKENNNERFMYITPFLDEVERVKKELPSFSDPKKVGGSKLLHLKELVKYGRNIASTHQLMDRFDLEVQAGVEIGEYILILDEVADVVSSYDALTEADKADLLNNYVKVDADGYLVWDESIPNHSREEYTYPSKFYNEMILCFNRNLVMVEGEIMYWELPTSLFSKFKEVYILTYIFEGSSQKAYFDLFDIEYEYLSVDNGKLIPYTPTPYETRQEIKSLIKLVTKDKLNEVGKDYNAFSSTWLKNNIKRGTVTQKRVKLDTENFFKNIAQTKAEFNMWTTLKGGDEDNKKEKGKNDKIKTLLKGIGYGKDAIHFVPFNIRATNKYQHKRALAYLINVYPHQTLTMYFNLKESVKDVKLNLDAYALSHLIQWIWRSSIRRQDLPKEEREIHLYLPSRRMREILLNWLDKKD